MDRLASSFTVGRRTSETPQRSKSRFKSVRMRFFQIGHGLEPFDGEALNLIEAAEKSAMKLLSLITAHFPGFRDHAVYEGEQVFFLKRAQIFIGDVWGSFEGKGLGEFHDIGQLTMFADYVVPQYLHDLGILIYSDSLRSMAISFQIVSFKIECD